MCAAHLHVHVSARIDSVAVRASRLALLAPSQVLSLQPTPCPARLVDDAGCVGSALDRCAGADALGLQVLHGGRCGGRKDWVGRKRGSHLLKATDLPVHFKRLPVHKRPSGGAFGRSNGRAPGSLQALLALCRLALQLGCREGGSGSPHP